MSDPYEGFHRRRREDYNGWLYFQVYSRRGVWFYSPYDHRSGLDVGMEEGPFDTAKDAYKHAETGEEIRDSDRNTPRDDYKPSGSLEDMARDT